MGWLRESSKLANYGHSQTTSRGIIYRYFEALSSVSQRREVWESQPYRVTGFEWKLILWKWITLVEQRKGKNQKKIYHDMDQVLSSSMYKSRWPS